MDTLFDDVPEVAPPPELELPPIQGTERQFNWATSVRRKKLEAIREFLASCQAYADRIRLTNAEKAEAYQHGIDETQARFAVLCAETKAQYWLNRRDNTVEELLNDAPAKPGGKGWFTGVPD